MRRYSKPRKVTRTDPYERISRIRLLPWMNGVKADNLLGRTSFSPWDMRYPHCVGRMRCRRSFSLVSGLPSSGCSPLRRGSAFPANCCFLTGFAARGELFARDYTGIGVRQCIWQADLQSFEQGCGGGSRCRYPQAASTAFHFHLRRAEGLQLMQAFFHGDVQRSPRPAEFPPDQVGEHHDKNMAAGMVRSPHVDGTDFQVDRLARTKRLLDESQILVAVVHHLLGSGAGGKIGLDDVTTVQPRSLFQRRLVHR